MPVLVGLVTYLALSGTPGPWVTYDAKAEDTGAKADLTGITGLSLNGTPGRSYGTFTAKTESTEDSRSVVDTYRIVFTMGDVNEVDALLTDAYRLVIGMSGYAMTAKVASDTYVPVLTLTMAALDKSQATPKAGADSYVPVLTMAATLPVDQFATTDTYVPVLTMGTTVSSSDEVVIADSYVPTLDMVPYVQGIQASIEYAVLDAYVVSLTMGASRVISGEVDRIVIEARPFWTIRIEEV